MPVGWTRVGTPDDLRELLSNPDAFEARVDEIVADAGAVVTHVYWLGPGGPAYVVSAVPVHDADEIFARLEDSLGPTDRLQSLQELKRG